MTGTRLALVMGAGGVVGWPFHLGVLEGLRRATGLSISDASRVVGTSSGAAISAATLTGRAPEAILATAVSGPDDESLAELRAAVANLRKPWRWMRPQAPRLVRKTLRNPTAAAVGMLPGGLFPTRPLRRFVDSDDVEWPTSLWIPVVALDEGKVVVLGRDRTDVSLRDAIEATAAVPIMMRAKRLDGVAYVDGAVHSATHGDLLDGADHDLVVISSLMTRPGRGPVKARARRQLASEVEALRASGAHVVVVEPTASVMAKAAGFPRTNPGSGRTIVAAAADLTEQAFAS